jgi:hypothetical protein
MAQKWRPVRGPYDTKAIAEKDMRGLTTIGRMAIKAGMLPLPSADPERYRVRAAKVYYVEYLV